MKELDYRGRSVVKRMAKNYCRILLCSGVYCVLNGEIYMLANMIPTPFLNRATQA